MRTAYTADQIRSAEHALMARLPEGTLMQRAATALAVVCARALGRVYGSRVTLLIGSGDNGGDALYAGARLARRGARVEAILAGSRAHQGGLAALRAAGGRVIEHAGHAEHAGRAVAAADLIVDGLVGIGAAGALREPYAGLTELANGADATVVAVDVPSGVDASTGRVEGAAVRAHLTVTFGACKTGLLIDPGASHVGTLEVIDIGIGPHLPDPDVTALTAADVAARLPRPGPESDKYRRGVVGVVAGSARYTGAAVLAVGGAVRGGAGMVRFASAREPVELVRARWPEAVTTILDTTILEGDGDARAGVESMGRVQAWVLGPGMGTDDRAHALAEAVLDTGLPTVLDADGLTLLAADRSLLRPNLLITPHAGELSRLIGVPRERIEASRLEHVRLAAADLGVTVLLKGSTTLVAETGRPVRVNGTGTPWLATGGTGDVLSGLAGALLAGGLTCYEAGSCAAYLHGLAARVAGMTPISAQDLPDALPEARRALDSPAKMEE
ncbi:NAD(P)H-hydrate dehydratase [Thermopolyspora sp. NPDC052614]|uniref:NAD(P)H-hydrate dehydratase n=1 Tax=Thermopolyspora sp. NPDC052614 TaxID=3155682 RepID=UPI003432499B